MCSRALGGQQYMSQLKGQTVCYTSDYVLKIDNLKYSG